MSTAQGILTRNSANRITLVFVIDEVQVIFSGTISPAIQPFSANNATLTYNDVDELSSTRSFNGQIGPGSFKLMFNNGVTAKGDLSLPGVSPAVAVDGSGAWEQN